MKTYISLATVLLLTACGSQSGASRQMTKETKAKIESENTKESKTPRTVHARQSTAAELAVVADFINQLLTELEVDPQVAAADQDDSNYSVTLATGKRLSIRSHTENKGPLGDAIFSEFRVETASVTTGEDATCLKESLEAAKVAGYEPRYVGILFSDTTMFFGYGRDDKQEMLTYDVATGVCYASWDK